MRKKKILSIALVACVAFSAFGCGGEVKEEYPEYEDTKSMWIGGWDVPVNTLADYQMAKDMGLTHMFIDGFMEQRGSEGFFNQLKHCEQVGLKAIVGMDTSLNNTDNVQLDETDYSAYPAVDMINVWDEPYGNWFDEVGNRITRLNEIYAGKDMDLYVNQTPYNNTASADITIPTEEFLNSAWEKMLSKMNGRKILSTDIYPLLTKYGENVLDTMWLYTMEAYANFTKAHKADGAEFHMFIQSYSDGSRREITSKADLEYQVYTDMAFGINGFTYFTYRKSFLGGFGGGCVENGVSCKPTVIYDWAKELNAEISEFDHVYLSFDWNGVMGINGTNNTADNDEYKNESFSLLKTPLAALDCANSVKATEDTIIGQFKDKDGRDGLIVTNFSEPSADVRDKVSFEFKDANRALVYRDGKRKVYEVKEGKLDIKLDAGEGVFVIPVKL